MGELTRRAVLATVGGTIAGGATIANNRDTLVGGGPVTLPSDDAIFAIASDERLSPDDATYEALRLENGAGLALSGLSGLTLKGGA